ncbi:MAG: hypothetical protein QOE47_798 [Pyrinomonadaceae bacterium]|nr:hypothetical protein [Pyrinomonadaceae bacterium]
MKPSIHQLPPRVSQAHNAKLLRALLIALCLLVVGTLATRLFINTRAAAARESSPRREPASLSERVSVRAAGRGAPYLNLTDGRETLTAYVGADEHVAALRQNKVTPLSLSAADFDEDGVPDVVGGYASADGALLVLRRGNVDTLHPNAPAAKERKANGTFTAAPFLAPARVFDSPAAPDFIGAGDFDADGHWDVVAAARGGESIYLLRGDGKGNFSQAEELPLPGRVTSLICGEMNQADGLNDVVVAVESSAGARLLIFEAPVGALRAQPEVLELPAAANALALGQLDDDAAIDLAVGAGTELLRVYGRDRRLSQRAERRASVAAAQVDTRALPYAVKSLALGDFNNQQEMSLALLGDDGAVHLLSPHPAKEKGTATFEPLAAWRQERLPAGQWAGATQLVRAKVSSLPGDDLLILDGGGRQLHVLTGDKLSAQPLDGRAPSKADEIKGGLVSLDATGAPVAMLPMQLDVDALEDLVQLSSDSASPVVAFTAQDSAVSAGRPLQAVPGLPSATYPLLGKGSPALSLPPDGKPTKATPAGAKAGAKTSGAPGGIRPQFANCPSTPINYGQSLSGALTTTDCRFIEGSYFDSYTFNGIAGQQVAIALNSGVFDTFLYLLAPDDSAIAIDDDGNGGTNSRIPATTGFITLPFNGTYTILVSSFEPSVTGAYLLSVGINATTCAPTPLTIGQVYNGSLGVTDCVLLNGAYGDAYTFNGLAGQQIAVLMSSPSFDTLLYVLAPNNTLLAVGDDANFFDSRIPGGGGYLTLPASGTYTIAASAFSAAVTGNYQLVVFNNPNGCPVTPIAYGQTLGGTLSTSDCIFTDAQNVPHYADSYTFFGLANQPIVIRQSSTVVDSYLYLYGPDGSLVTSDDDGGGGHDSRIPPGTVFGLLPQNGLYTIISTSFNRLEIGGYTLSLSVDIGGTTVTNTNDNGTGSLRQAILVANANPGADTIRFSIGTGARTITPLFPLPAITGPVTIDGTTQPGYAGVPLIELNGIQAGAQTVGLKILGGNSRVRGLVINRFSIAAIALTAGGSNRVDGNYIGTDLSGLNPQPAPLNGAIESQGILIDSSLNNVVGGTTAASRNVISGNREVGVLIERSGRLTPTGNLVQGNYIGLNASGNAAFGNGGNGVVFLAGSDNIVGGTVAGARNIISGNAGPGVALGGFSATVGNLVQGNYIGTNVAGTAALGAQNAGVIVGGVLQRSSELVIATRNTIGGTTVAARNVISGNMGSGVEVINTGTIENNVQGNYIGCDVSGTAVVRNLNSGVFVTFANNNTVGGDAPGAGNVIVGNGDFGIGVGLPKFNPLTNQPIIGGKGIDILGNYIGTNTGGTARLGNGLDGVLIAADAVNNTVTNNVIASNTGNGIFIPRTTPGSPSNNPGIRNNLDANLIYQNALFGIDLQDPGITPNDPLDVDGGANLQQNFPLITSVSRSVAPPPPTSDGEGYKPLVAGAIRGMLNSAANTTYVLQFYYSSICQNSQSGSRPLPLVKRPVVTNGQGNADFLFPFEFPGSDTAGFVNGTATDPQGNTSELSACMSVGVVSATPAIGFSAATYSVGENGARATLTVTRTGDTSSAVTADYRTQDGDTFTVGCADTVNNRGAAYARCDFATGVGIVSFAPGETSKQLTVPVLDDGRAEGNETFQVKLSNPGGGATLGAPDTATVTIIDNDAAGAANPIFQTPFFVRMQYLDFLSREPEVDEPWSGVLNRCPNVNTGPEVASGCDRILVSLSFFGSPEFQLKGFYVFRFYKLAYNRLPEYLEIIPDMSFVAGSTPAEVFQRKAQLATLFTQRSEFVSAYGGLTNAQFVNALLARYGLTQVTTLDPLQPDGVTKVTLTNAELTSRLNASTLSRAQVFRAIADSDQAAGAEFNNAFVGMQYYGYLRRKPDAAGYQDWLRVLLSGNQRLMVNGFMNSAEYRLRFGQP